MRQAFTADSDVCPDQLREWHRHGVNVSSLDLRKAYLQLRIEQQLWLFQTMMVRGRRYCLTRLGFGLNITPLVMKVVVKTILTQDSVIKRAVLPTGQLQWTRDNVVTCPLIQVTCRPVFAWCGRLLAHLPLGGWLRPAPGE